MRLLLIFIFMSTFSFGQGTEEVLSEMSLFRNEIYARHGRSFSSQDLREYFNSKEWYKPNEGYDSGMLSEREILAAKTILKIEQQFEQMEERERSFAIEASNYIRLYSLAPLDTTLLTIAKFDNDEILDTITTRIHEKCNQILIEYEFRKKGKLLWEEQNSDPYFFLGDSEALESYKSGNILLRSYSALRFSKAVNEKMWEGPYDEYIINNGLAVLRNNGISLTFEEYQKYLNSFRGDLIIHSMDEVGYDLQIWYEPLQSFITFYAP